MKRHRIEHVVCRSRETVGGSCFASREGPYLMVDTFLSKTLAISYFLNQALVTP
jgi:hypothetical protein